MERFWNRMGSYVCDQQFMDFSLPSILGHFDKAFKANTHPTLAALPIPLKCCPTELSALMEMFNICTALFNIADTCDYCVLEMWLV